MLDTLLNTDGFQLTSAQKLQRLREIETLSRQLYAAKAQLVKTIDIDNVAADYGAASTKHLIRDTLRLTPAAASRLMADADALGAGRTLLGEPTPPRLAALADAARHGVVDVDQIQV